MLVNRRQQEEGRDTFITIISYFFIMKIKIPTNTGNKLVFTGQQEAGRSADKNQGKEKQVHEKHSATIKFAHQIHVLENADGGDGWEAGGLEFL